MFAKVLSAILCFIYVLSSANGGTLITKQRRAQATLSMNVDNTGTLQEFEWDRAPHSDATGNLIFASMSSLLELWPNTAYRVGHTVVPVTMSKGTLMYHGRDYPAGPGPKESDWMAFDFEHAYVFASFNSAFDPGYVFEYVATRDLKLLYFDGSSAAKVFGAFDSQDVVVDHKVHKDLTWEYEMQRLQRLCMWGKSLGIDGFVRMQAHFEVMYCDFTDGFDLVQVIDVLPQDHCDEYVHYTRMQMPNTTSNHTTFHSSPSPTSDPCLNAIPGWIGRLPVLQKQQALAAGKWHDFAPGETRVRPDYSRAVTFYDPALRSLVEARRGQTRSQHRLLNITYQDADMKIKELEDVLTRKEKPVNGTVNWGSVMRTVVERYSQRLELLNNTLSSNDFNVTYKAALVRRQLLTMILPYMTRSDVAIREGDPTSHAWLLPAMRRCSTTLPDSISTTLFTPQERLIHGALRETVQEICRRVSRAFSAAFDLGEIPESQINAVLGDIEEEIHELMEWLGWTASWSKCQPACEWDEICFLPTWPIDRLNLDNMVPRCKSMFDPW